MKPITIILAILILATLGTIIYFYFTFEKPSQEKQIAFNFTDINIYAEFNGSGVSTGYVILSSSYSENGTTLAEAPILEKVLQNTTYEVYNYNLDNQSFYQFIANKYAVPYQSMERIKMPLISPGSLSIRQYGNLRDYGTTLIPLNVSSIGEVRNLDFCVVWSARINHVTSNFTQIDKPLQYANTYDRCFSTGTSLNDSSMIINLDYLTFSDLGSSDYLKVIFYDQDIDPLTNQLISFKDNQDLWMPDKEYDVQ